MVIEKENKIGQMKKKMNRKQLIWPWPHGRSSHWAHNVISIVLLSLIFFSLFLSPLPPPSLFLALFSKNKKLQKNPLLDHPPPPPPCLPKEAKISPMDHRLPGLQATITSSQPLRAGMSPRREGTGTLLVST